MNTKRVSRGILIVALIIVALVELLAHKCPCEENSPKAVIYTNPTYTGDGF